MSHMFCLCSYFRFNIILQLNNSSIIVYVITMNLFTIFLFKRILIPRESRDPHPHFYQIVFHSFINDLYMYRLLHNVLLVYIVRLGRSFWIFAN